MGQVHTAKQQRQRSCNASVKQEFYQPFACNTSLLDLQVCLSCVPWEAHVSRQCWPVLLSVLHFT